MDRTRLSRRLAGRERDPLDAVQWVFRDLRMTREEVAQARVEDVGLNERLAEVELPAEWSPEAARVLLTRGGGACGSVRQWVQRMCEWVEMEGRRRGVFARPLDGATFSMELTALLLSQRVVLWLPEVWGERGAEPGCATLRLIRFLDGSGRVDVAGLRGAVAVTAQALQLGARSGAMKTRVDVADLGALLMASGVAYDSARGRLLGAALVALVSAELTLRAGTLGGGGALAMAAWRRRERGGREALIPRLRERTEERRAELERGLGMEDESRVMVIHGEAQQGNGPRGAETELERQTWELLRAAWEGWDAVMRGVERGEIEDLVLVERGGCAWAATALDADTEGFAPEVELVREERRRGCGDRRGRRRAKRVVGAGLFRLGYGRKEAGEILQALEETGVLPEEMLRVEHRPVFAVRREGGAAETVPGPRGLEPAEAAAQRMRLGLALFARDPDQVPTHVAGRAVPEWRGEAAAGPVRIDLAGAAGGEAEVRGSVEGEQGATSPLLREHIALLKMRMSEAEAEGISEGKATGRFERAQVVPEKGAAAGERAAESAARAEVSEAWNRMETGRRLPVERQALTHSFRVGGRDGVVTVGLYADGAPGEILVRMPREGSAIRGLLEAFSTVASMALQHGVPLRELVEQLVGTEFEPAGETANPEIPTAQSAMDYLFRWMERRFLTMAPSQ